MLPGGYKVCIARAAKRELVHYSHSITVEQSSLCHRVTTICTVSKEAN